MTERDQLANTKDEILALPKGEIKRPSVPILVAIFEAEYLVVAATEDVEELSSINCTREKIDRLENLTTCARVAALTLDETEGQVKEMQTQWKKTDYPNALKKKKDLLAMCDLCFVDEPTLQVKVSKIKKRRSILGTLNDLTHLSVLGVDNADKLAKYNLTTEAFQEAAELVTELTRKRAMIDGETYLDSDEKLYRDKAITLMQREVKYIRDCGKFVFRENPNRLSHYSSAYLRDKNKKSRLSK